MSDERTDLTKELLTRNACIYSNERKRLSAAMLRGVRGISNVVSDGGFFKRPSFFRMRVGESNLRLNATTEREKIKERTKGMHDWVNRFHEASPIQNLALFHHYIDQITQVYGVQVDSEFAFGSPVWKALLKISEPIDGVIFAHDSFIDCDGRILFGYLVDLVREHRTDRG